MTEYLIAKKQDVGEGEGIVSIVNDHSIAVFNRNNKVYAIGNRCPHRGGPLAEGELDEFIVRCPWHAWEFDIRTGCNPENEQVKVPCYKLRIDGDNIFVEL